MNQNNLNHPFFIYPRGIMSEYNYYELYRTEVIKFNKFIDNLFIEINERHEGEEILIPLIIGSAMEDCLVKSNTSNNNFFQYRQLFPNYINNFIESNSNNKFIQIIIISPDDIFSSKSYIPTFTLYESFDFILTNSNEYVYKDETINIKINIFNCPFPCVDNRIDLILSYENILKKINSYDILSYRQTQEDLQFIDIFYLNLDKLFSLKHNHMVKIIINSWVCFKNLYGYSENYNMFPKLLSLANKYNIIATEWEFIDELFHTKIISKYIFGDVNFYGTNINYVFDEYLRDLPENLAKIKFSSKNLFVIDFNSLHFLKKINF